MRPGAVVALGATLALLLVGGVVSLAMTGALEGLAPQEPLKRVLVIVTSPDEDGTPVASFAFVLEKGRDEPVVLDTTRPVAVTGTSARTAREAYPYVGATGVAHALESQTGDTQLEWITLPQDVWVPLVDRAGGIQSTVPSSLSAYLDGSLVVLQAGGQRLSGSEIAAVGASVEYFKDESQRVETMRSLTSGLSAVLDAKAVAELVGDGKGRASVSTSEIREFARGL